MTPSLFAGTDVRDEFSLMQTPGAREKLERHRRTFITEADFQWIATHGLNAIRLPVGHWLFEDIPPYRRHVQYVDQAMDWAAKYGLKVLLDLHTAPGSQNGHDHSGRIGPIEWHAHRQYQRHTIELLEQIARRYRDHPALWGIELLNEPKKMWWQWTLRRFYKQAYGRLRAIVRPGTVIVFHDAFTPRLLNGVLYTESNCPVIMDVHWYQFGDWLLRWRTARQYLQRVGRRRWLLAWLQWWQPVIVGEWSIVISDKTLRREPKERHAELQMQHGIRQLEAYGHAAGWFYWSYKTERPGNWHFRSLVETGIVKLPR